jgi:hypothetical protein
VSTPPDRAELNQQVQAVLGVAAVTAAEIVQAFDDVVAKPLQLNLSKKKGRELAKRNPMIYTVRGTTTVRGVGGPLPAPVCPEGFRRRPGS